MSTVDWENMSDAACFGVLVLFVAYAVCAPFILIWSVNTLFGLAIPITFKTLLAASFIIALIW